MDVSEAIRTRRSHKMFGGVPIPDADLQHILDLAIWAPNHKFTEPWRFTVVPHRSLEQLWQAVHAAAHSEKALTKLPKLHEIILSAGAAIAVRQVRSPDAPERDREDYAACACAIQNLQLGAWERGWVSYWTTSAGFLGENGPSGDTLRAFWRCEPGETIIGVVLLGKAILDMPAIRRHSAASLSVWL